ncbi:hypothetical protein HY404_03670 [Candidatus Microgenomates bacterium]|nr:hypothetical protein [Candidatus Microgenomates bacterium]
MEVGGIFEGIGNIFKRKEPKVLAPKENRWSYNYFREYLLASLRGKDFLLPQDQYPDKIELSPDWYITLNQMRQETQDGFERWALIGFKEDKRTLYLPRLTAKGLSDKVTPDIMNAQINKARSQVGIVDLLGHIHSHPRGPFLQPEDSSTSAFSAHDLYFSVAKPQPMFMLALVEGNENLFVFRAKDSEDLDRSIFNQESFSNYWQEKMLSARNINWGMAERHRLVLYRSKAGQDLEKVFPPRTSLATNNKQVQEGRVVGIKVMSPNK